MEKNINVEEGYHIALYFLHEIGCLLEPKFQGSEELKNIHELFFYTVCAAYEASKEWKQALNRALGISSDRLRAVKLSEEDVFSCALEFCKIHNERWKGKLDIALQYLKAMQAEPNNYKEAWRLWTKLTTLILINKIRGDPFKW